MRTLVWKVTGTHRRYLPARRVWPACEMVVRKVHPWLFRNIKSLQEKRLSSDSGASGGGSSSSGGAEDLSVRPGWALTVRK